MIAHWASSMWGYPAVGRGWRGSILAEVDAQVDTRHLDGCRSIGAGPTCRLIAGLQIAQEFVDIEPHVPRRIGREEIMGSRKHVLSPKEAPRIAVLKRTRYLNEPLIEVIGSVTLP